jgi:hypothetical protein
LNWWKRLFLVYSWVLILPLVSYKQSMVFSMP